jgi:hypothetical protein
MIYDVRQGNEWLDGSRINGAPKLGLTSEFSLVTLLLYYTLLHRFPGERFVPSQGGATTMGANLTQPTRVMPWLRGNNDLKKKSGKLSDKARSGNSLSTRGEGRAEGY